MGAGRPGQAVQAVAALEQGDESPAAAASCDLEQALGHALVGMGMDQGVREGIEVVEQDCNINDPEFSEKAVEMMLALIDQGGK